MLFENELEREGREWVELSSDVRDTGRVTSQKERERTHLGRGFM